jgi:GTP-binding protein Era
MFGQQSPGKSASISVYLRFSTESFRLRLPVRSFPTLNTEPPAQFRAGMAVLVGRTNAGKSTLLNALVGRKVSIVTPKPQTTRDPIHGVVNRPEGQIVFVDTPGFFKTHKSRLVDTLHQRARKALEGIDVVIHLADPTRSPGEEDDMVSGLLARVRQPRILCLGKADLPERTHRDHWLARAADYVAVVDASGVTQQGHEELIGAILRYVPVGEPLYPPGDVSNASREFRIRELVREQVYLQMGDEIPYRTVVEVDRVHERQDKQGQPLLAVDATIVVANDRYKAMLIGAGGQRIKKLGMSARVELEREFGRKVFLDLEILVDRKLAD